MGILVYDMFSQVIYRTVSAAFFFILLSGLPPAARAQTTTATWQWAARGSSSGTNNTDNSAYLIAADAAGNTVVAGTFSGTMALGSTTLASTGVYSGCVAKYTPAGTMSWAQRLSSTAGTVYPTRLALDGAGNSYLTGEFYQNLTIGAVTLTDPLVMPGNIGQPNGFVLKLDAQGMVQWALRLGGTQPQSIFHASCEGLAVDAAGNVAVTGYYQGNVELAGVPLPGNAANDTFYYVARLANTSSAAPTVQWVRTAAGLSNDRLADAAFGPTGELYASAILSRPMTFGAFTLPGVAAGVVMAVLQYDASGTVQWARQLANPLPTGVAAVHLFPCAMVADTTGVSMLLRASAFAPSTTTAAQLVKLRPPGTPGWSYTTTVSQYEGVFQGLAADASGNLYVCGSVQGSATLGGLSLSSTTPATRDGMLLSFTAQGSPRWGQVVSSGLGQELLVAVAASAPDQLHVAGYATGDARLGSFSLPATASNNEWLTGRLRVNVVTATQLATASALHLAPNPAHNMALLTLPAAPTPQAFALLDALGRPVRHYTVPAGATTARLNVAGLPAGLYVLRGAGASRKLVVE
ncbi:hypothetical protein Q5H93_05315 [Hymenobacter sp. ASUV-10]|uniref:T9SS type A sorting domain-containing protein n=1 Tax=Hymenobacter aranciens TaxID=3063996 RepID=A0ABT9B7H1_9BACT|nr:hypothetical protein [Hymenobacter sp. ASUV-10]MDO7874143.1 hypothetical protein [Hymenobacter sp. ASUV-10]